MKPSNLVKRFDSGWLVGLNSRNDVIVESPKKSVFHPYLHGTTGEVYDSQVTQTDETLPVEVKVFVKGLIVQRNKLRSAVARDTFEDFDDESEDEEVFDTPTMQDLGFGDGIAHLDMKDL